MTIPPDRFDTRLNVQNVITALALAGGLIAWANSVGARITVVETRQQAQTEVTARQNVEKDRAEAELNARLQRMENKIDSLMERRH